MKEIISNPKYEQAITLELDRVRLAVQAVVSIWNNMGFDPIVGNASLYEILWNPSVPYNEQVGKMKIIPDSVAPEIAETYLAGLKIPDSGNLYRASEKAQRSSYCLRELGLFTISDGKTVDFSKEETRKIIKAQSVYGTQRQYDYYLKLKKWIDDLNELNEIASGRLLSENSRSFSQVFGTPAKITPGVYDVTIDPEGLRELFKIVK